MLTCSRSRPRALGWSCSRTFGVSVIPTRWSRRLRHRFAACPDHRGDPRAADASAAVRPRGTTLGQSRLRPEDPRLARGRAGARTHGRRRRNSCVASCRKRRPVNAAVDPTRCPLCGDANGASSRPGKATCWCFETPVPNEILARCRPRRRVSRACAGVAAGEGTNETRAGGSRCGGRSADVFVMFTSSFPWQSC